jgi:hypothetical protein
VKLDPRTLLLDVLAVGIIASLACAHDDRTAELVERYRPTLEDAGLGWGLGRLNGLSIRVHPLSDGGTFPNPRYDGGPGEKPFLVDDASYACPSFKGERVCWVHDLDSPIVGHCLAHVARSDFIPDGGSYCMSDLPYWKTEDHAYFAAVKLDDKCKAVTP